MENSKFRVVAIDGKHDGSSGDGELLTCRSVVERSGIYEVLHGAGHKGANGATVVALRGESLKPCNVCGEDIRFRMVYEAQHVSEDPDFSAQRK